MAKRDAQIGRILADRYRLDRVLGRGGMGEVYAATDTESTARSAGDSAGSARGLPLAVDEIAERPVAVKILRPEFTGPDLVARFFQEAKTAAALRHPNVIDVLDMGDDAGVAFLVMELLEGESLEARLKREKRLPAQDVLRILVPVIDALSVAHARGIIHRDLKPENVFLSIGHHEREVPKLLDFGIAKLLDNSVFQTQAGILLGTPGYMSPEQMRGVSALTPASDVWGMGVMLFRALAGRLPFEVDPNPTAMVMKILTSEVPRLHDVAPDVPQAIAAAVDLALKHSPDTRHHDMIELLESLLEAARADGVPVEAPTTRLPADS